MNDDRTIVKREFLSGTTRRVSFQIVNGETGLGFQPDTLTMSIYDVDFGDVSVTTPAGARLASSVIAATQTIVNDRNDVDVIDSCDTDGNVEVFLDPEDTTVDVPSMRTPLTIERRVLFTWTWDSPTKTGKHEIVLAIAPDRETEAT